MKQPLVFVPPAQAEALFDAELEEERSKFPRTKISIPSSEDWDDGTGHAETYRYASPERSTLVAPQKRAHSFK